MTRIMITSPHPTRRAWATLCLVIPLVSLLTIQTQPSLPRPGGSALLLWAQIVPRDTPEPPGGVYRVYYDTRERLDALAVHFDIWEVQRQAGYAVLGLDAKLSQYTRGKAFVDHVVNAVGMARFNTVWSGPETLPLPPEIEDPQRWINRVL